MDKSAILSKIDSDISDLELTILESVDSTNDYLRNIYLRNTHFRDDDLATPYLKIVVADTQTQGKGRLGRHWISPAGVNIYFSCLTKLAMSISEMAPISLVVGLALVKTLEQYTAGHRFSIKWPNDILYNQSKVAGILIESVARYPGMVIIGIGVNVNMLDNVDINDNRMLDINHDITQEWSSLAKITGQVFDRNEIIASLVNHLLIVLPQFERYGFAFFLEQWQHYDMLCNKKLALKTGEKTADQQDIIVTGIAKGLNAQGQLLIQTEEGSLQAFACGQASILK